jgi:PAS domain S-box-containing protein
MMMSRPGFARSEQTHLDAVTIRWTADAKGRITFFSRDWSHYTGVPDGEVCGSTDAWIACVHPDDRHFVRAIWTARSAQADSYTIRFRLLGQDGIFRQFQGVAVPVREAESISSWAGYCEPVTLEQQ